MSVYGTEAWSRYGDAFGVYFSLFSRLSPLHWARGELRAAPAARRRAAARPGAGNRRAAVHDDRHDSFDGFSQGPLWTGTNGLGIQLQHRFLDLGFNAETALEIGVHDRAVSGSCSSSAGCTGSG